MPDHTPDSNSDPARSSPAPAPTRSAMTMLLSRAGEGDAKATDELFPIVYEELRTIAAKFLHAEHRAQTMQATALVHEAYLRLIGDEQTPWDSRAHFFGAAARAIRRILIDHARHRTRIKRGGGMARAPLSEALSVCAEPEVDMLGLDDALTRLAAVDPQKARVVELRFFAGLTADQTALTMGISPSTVARDWQFARVWLAREIERADAGPSD
jgi:RNA polymerase sigma factor (TIGR02999 family)